MTGDDPILAAITERAAKATPGPWEASFTIHGDPSVTQEGRGQFGLIATIGVAPADYGRTNAEFIAHARSDIPLLLARVGELEAENEKFVRRYASQLCGLLDTCGCDIAVTWRGLDRKEHDDC